MFDNTHIYKVVPHSICFVKRVRSRRKADTIVRRVEGRVETFEERHPIDEVEALRAK